MEHHLFYMSIKYKWQFSIAMLVYQRVHVTKNHGGKVGNVIYTDDNFTSKFQQVNVQYVYIYIYIFIYL